MWIKILSVLHLLYFSSSLMASTAAEKSVLLSKELSTNSGNFLEVLLSLFAVVILIFLLAAFIKRLGCLNISQNQCMQIKASLALSTKEKLMIVQVGGEQIVIGVAPGFVGHIKTLSEPLLVEDKTSSTHFSNKSFSNAFKNILQKNAKSDVKDDA